jgi:hypothetical protein
MKYQSIKIIILVFGTLILTGCHKVEATTTVESNGSGKMQMGVGFSAEERANLEKQYNNSQDFCNTTKPPPSATVIEEQRGEETWCITISSFEDLEELRSLYGQREGIKINRLEISDGKFYYDIEVDTLSESSSFSALTEITWSIVLPGVPLSHNADQVDGSKLTWVPTPKSGIVNLRAESEAHRGFNFLPCSTAFIGLGAVLLHVRRRGKNSPFR